MNTKKKAATSLQTRAAGKEKTITALRVQHDLANVKKLKPTGESIKELERLYLILDCACRGTHDLAHTKTIVRCLLKSCKSLRARQQALIELIEDAIRQLLEDAK